VHVELNVLGELIQTEEQVKNFQELENLVNTDLLRSESPRGTNDSSSSEYINQDLFIVLHQADRVLEQINKMMIIEKESGDLRKEEHTHLSTMTSLYIIALFLGSLLILTVAYLKTTNSLKQSQLLREQLLFQNKERESRAAELIMANNELLVENEKKEKLAAEFIIANKELLFQNSEKEKRAAELIVANKELLFQNSEKEKRAAELIVANKELLFQNEEREKRAAELSKANKELQLFVHISSHDLQEPIRKIQMSASRISETDLGNLSEKGKGHFKRMQEAALGMQTLVEDLEKYSRTKSSTGEAEYIDLKLVVKDIENEFRESLDEKASSIDASKLGSALVVPFQFRQMLHNLVGNALKFSKPGEPTTIVVDSEIIECDRMFNDEVIPHKEYTHIKFMDNGIGFEPEYAKVIFEVFQRLHGKDEYKGSGIGLAIVKKIVENQDGHICATGVLNEGARFDIYFPTNKYTRL
jgi:signal transduction histidine kinase